MFDNLLHLSPKWVFVDLGVAIGHCFAIYHTIHKAFAGKHKVRPILSKHHWYAAAIENTHHIHPLLLRVGTGQDTFRWPPRICIVVGNPFT